MGCGHWRMYERNVGDVGYYVAKGGNCDDRCYDSLLEWVKCVLCTIIMIYD